MNDKQRLKLLKLAYKITKDDVKNKGSCNSFNNDLAKNVAGLNHYVETGNLLTHAEFLAMFPGRIKTPLVQDV